MWVDERATPAQDDEEACAERGAVLLQLVPSERLRLVERHGPFQPKVEGSNP